MVSQRCSRLTAALSTLVIAGSLAFTVPARAQTPAQHHNWVQRHPTATSLGAAWATHHALKVSARNKKRRHQHLSFAERHPTLTGIGVGVGTHHLIKSTTH